jgi:hypothetical protein
MPKFFWLLPLSPADWRRSALSAFTLSFLSCTLLQRYWQFFHLGTQGTGLALLLFALPLLTVVGIIVSLSTTLSLRARGLSSGSAFVGATLLVAALCSAVFVAELQRSRAARSGEGDHAGDLAPFFRSLVRFR